VLAKKQQFEKGTAPYQDVDLLITLRSALVHFDPEATSQSGASAGNIEKRLKGKFPLNPMTGRKTAVLSRKVHEHRAREVGSRIRCEVCR
jgi:hypothetical protein